MGEGRSLQSGGDDEQTSGEGDRVEIEIDQSIKIEQSQQATTLAFANGEARVIVVPARVKQVAIRRLRRVGLTGSRATLWLFSAAIFLLIRDHLPKITRIIIDIEYQGHEADVRLILLNFIRYQYPQYPARTIVFQQVGKKSPAHALAFKAHKGRVAAGQVVGWGDFEMLLRQK